MSTPSPPADAPANAEGALGRWIDRGYAYRRVVLALVGITLIVVANQTAFWLRFDGVTPPEQQPLQYQLLPLLIVLRLLVFVPFRLIDGVWRYASIWDLRNIVGGVITSSILFYLTVHFALGLTLYPRSIVIIDAGLLMGLMGGLRMSRRVYRDLRTPPLGRKLLVYGAGDAGEMIVRDIRRNAEFRASPVGFVDDDSRKHGQRIHGIPVLGSRHDLASIIEKTGAEEVLVAIPSARPDVLRQIVRKLEPFRVRITTLPRLSDLVGEPIGLSQVRQLRLEDLLARPQVALDYGPVRDVITNRTVLVTGAGGSIGSELCRQIATLKPGRIVLLDRYENSLHEITREVAAAHPGLPLHCVVADITDSKRLDQVFARSRPEVVFHAAAHKHVPLMEDNPSEAIKNNVRGTRLVAGAALRWGADRFVLISTDKAVNPTSVMGAAKRAAEMVVKSLDSLGRTRFMVVRFGNVLGSNGSVVPTFLAQIAAGGPVTVTHPEMRRFFMLIPEAVQLVLHAAAINDRGSIFVLEMGEQVRVEEMARDLVRLSGHVPDKEIGIIYTGVRPGEKLHEELVSADESAMPSTVPQIMKVLSPMPRSPQELEASLDTLEAAALDGLDDAVIAGLRNLVPSFTPFGRKVECSAT